LDADQRGLIRLDPGLLYSIRFRAARQPPVEDYLPEHNARFAKPAALPETAFVPVADKSALAETLCVHVKSAWSVPKTVPAVERSRPSC
jgi:hypothetical protein